MTGRTRVLAHEVRRLEVAVDLAFEEFRQRYEQAVLFFNPDHFGDLDPDRTDWAVIRRITDEQAPHDFLLYWRGEVDLMMRAAGHARCCTSYLMGNHTIAERMYRHNPGVMLYAPLRTTIYEDHDDQLWFSVDQPSTRFSSFDDPEIAEVGVELDGKLADLFTTLGLVVPAELTR
ncbi:DUF302 domain-containing protein [Streptomyces sp. ID05-04B]|uniref:DUF302 domain-containing protein n=1 Tax=Streptomyces sp. ID05-04B TaxID=3028661 RepID=UPI0029C4CB61|nr:DUF302 domain-containing protein [Streptomyces sp. ID05-04B]MDX5562719.1 DUF302 domain-containing protein [Streptomyces sp. ID05-04B]